MTLRPLPPTDRYLDDDNDGRHDGALLGTWTPEALGDDTELLAEPTPLTHYRCDKERRDAVLAARVQGFVVAFVLFFALLIALSAIDRYIREIPL